jgi:hypothetical protein
MDCVIEKGLKTKFYKNETELDPGSCPIPCLSASLAGDWSTVVCSAVAPSTLACKIARLHVRVISTKVIYFNILQDDVRVLFIL